MDVWSRGRRRGSTTRRSKSRSFLIPHERQQHQQETTRSRFESFFSLNHQFHLMSLIVALGLSGLLHTQTNNRHRVSPRIILWSKHFSESWRKKTTETKVFLNKIVWGRSGFQKRNKHFSSVCLFFVFLPTETLGDSSDILFCFVLVSNPLCPTCLWVTRDKNWTTKNSKKRSWYLEEVRRSDGLKGRGRRGV